MKRRRKPSWFGGHSRAAVDGHIDFQGSFHGPPETALSQMLPPLPRRHRHHAAPIFISCCSLFSGIKDIWQSAPRTSPVPQASSHVCAPTRRLIGLISQEAGHIAVGPRGGDHGSPVTPATHHAPDSRRTERWGPPGGLDHRVDWTVWTTGREVLPISTGVWSHHLGALAPKTAHWNSTVSTKTQRRILDNSASLVAGTQGLPAVHCRATFRLPRGDEDQDTAVDNGQWTMACGAAGTASNPSHCAPQRADCCASNARGRPPSLDPWTESRDGASLSTVRDSEPSHGRPTFFSCSAAPVGVSDGRAAGNVALRVDEAVMRGIKMHGRERLVPGRRITTPDGASTRENMLFAVAGCGMRFSATHIAPFVLKPAGTTESPTQHGRHPMMGSVEWTWDASRPPPNRLRFVDGERIGREDGRKLSQTRRRRREGDVKTGARGVIYLCW
ncbi:hypothetical protein QBC39DRAFT_118534 [Podospora conica]|nr:hypothetical protein QBC39DRAFT_118534 [Schizothecium conicum]